MVSKTHEQSGNATCPPVFVLEIGSCFWAFKAADDKEICVAVVLRSLTLWIGLRQTTSPRFRPIVGTKATKRQEHWRARAKANRRLSFPKAVPFSNLSFLGCPFWNLFSQGCRPFSGLPLLRLSLLRRIPISSLRPRNRQSSCEQEVPSRLNSGTVVCLREFCEGDRKETLLRCRWRGCWRTSLGDRFSNKFG